MTIGAPHARASLSISYPNMEVPLLKEVTSKNFDREVIKRATYCGPCKAFATVLEKVEEEAGNEFKIVKVNAEEEPALAARFGVMSVPTLVVFHQGKVIGNHVGAGTKAAVLKKIRAILK
jgi:thioredoxin 1